MAMILPSQTELATEVVLPGGVIAIALRSVWDVREKPFPLSEKECFYLLQGWSVRPVGHLTEHEMLDLPGRPEGSSDTYLTLFQR